MKFKTGDILFVNKNTLWGKIVGKFQGDRFHHVGFVIVINDYTYVFEAISVGMAFTPIEEYIYKNNLQGYELLIKRHIDCVFDKADQSEILRDCLLMTDRPYEFLNLIGFQAIRMIFIKLFNKNIWLGRSKAKSKRSLICSELVALLYNNHADMFKNNWHKAAPSDLINHVKLQTIKHYS